MYSCSTIINQTVRHENNGRQRYLPILSSDLGDSIVHVELHFFFFQHLKVKNCVLIMLIKKKSKRVALKTVVIIVAHLHTQLADL